MAWQIEFTDEFGRWWDGLNEDEQTSVAVGVEKLELLGPSLGRPHVDTLYGSRHPNMKELRVQHRGEPYRVLFAFDPRRKGILLVGGNKGGDDRFYERMIPLADDLYDQHLEALKKEGLI
jgi:hypothetical protein